MSPNLIQITDRIRARSAETRERYLERIDQAAQAGPSRKILSCGNLAHGIAACGPEGKQALLSETTANIGIVFAYNDMLSAHQPFERYPDLIRTAARKAGAVAQFVGGVPVMCDGVT